MTALPSLEAGMLFGAPDSQRAAKPPSSHPLLYNCNNLDDPNIPETDRNVLQYTMAWVKDFIMQPHPLLGRAGDVCPFVRKAIQQNQMFLSICPLENPYCPDEFLRLMAPYVLWLGERLAETDASLERLLCCVLIFPNMPDDAARNVLEPLHKQIKGDLLRLGIIPGQFYPSCPIGSTWNRLFPVLQSPLPMLVLRQFIESDWRFMHDNPVWEGIYRQRFGEPVKPRPDFQPSTT